MTTDTRQILEKLDQIRVEVDYIRNHLVDIDAVLSEDDIEALADAEKDLRNGKTKRLD